MKNTCQIFINLLLVIFFIFLLSACNKKDDDTFQNNNWQTIYQNNDLDLYSIKFLDKDNGFVMADSSGIHVTSDWKYVLSTEDGGNTWNHVTCSSYDTVNQFPLYDIGKIFPMSENVLLATGYQVHKSIDKGKTWINVSSKFGPSINDLHIIDSKTWLVAAGTYIYKTNNGGQTWQTVFQKTFYGTFKHFTFPTTNMGYISLSAVNFDVSASVGLILKTTDSGETWTIMKPEPWKSNGISIPYICALQFVTDQIGYISTFAEYKLYKSADSGNNWTLIHNDNYTIGLEYFINENVGYYSDGVTIYVTNDGGKTWKVDYYNNAPSADILTWTFLETGQGYALTRDHRIIKNIN